MKSTSPAGVISVALLAIYVAVQLWAIVAYGRVTHPAPVYARGE
jgi:hypothetical protein